MLAPGMALPVTIRSVSGAMDATLANSEELRRGCAAMGGAIDA
jgi:hypothetical protein